MTRLAANVVLADPNGKYVTLSKGDVLPGWASGLVTNAKALEAEARVFDAADAVVDVSAAAPEPVPAPELAPAPDVIEEDDDTVDESPATPAAQDYEAMTVVALKAEIKARNEGREEDDRVPTDGAKADLIAALELDDETS